MFNNVTFNQPFVSIFQYRSKHWPLGDFRVTSGPTRKIIFNEM